jgi:hypothetical protein
MRFRELVVVAVVAVPGLALAGLSTQGLSTQGLSTQGLSTQGLSTQGLSTQGLSTQGLSTQGLSTQGLSTQSTQVTGVAPMGTDLLSDELTGVDIGWVEMRGTTAASSVQSSELTAGPGMSTGYGDYISVGGASAAGHYAVAHLVDVAGAPAEDLDLYVADERVDPGPNLLHRGDDQANLDVTLYTVFFFHRWSGRWLSLCPFHAATGGATAMAIAEDPGQPDRFIFACTATGVAAKCARGWGFRPWRTGTTYVFDDQSNDWVQQTYALAPFYAACKLAARAAYCQDRRSFTRNGTLIDLFDTRQLVWPNSVERPFGDDPDSRWMFAQELFVSIDPLASQPALKATALERTRYRELSPVGQCAALAYVDRLEKDHFEDGRWASPLTNTPRIEVFSPNYCEHDEHEVGAGLAWDCSPCTTSVCKMLPGCCRPGAGTTPDGAPAWDAACVAEADATCGDPPGRVWPRDLPPGPAAPQKLLVGPFGAVEGVDAPGPGNATAIGWACDPEWPGAAVTVAVYGGAPREQPGSALLGVVTADQALAAPLVREVSAACDGAPRDSARHGFSFALPPGAGSVFVYALDAATADGPAAPPTLVRNGIVTLPVPGGNPTFAAMTTGWIEAPASGSYTFRAAVEPSRVFVNGRLLVDWLDGSGPMEGSIDLLAGGKYQVRWDRVESPPPDDSSLQGLTWLAPGSGAQASIPPALLYRVSPGGGQGLAASYFDQPGFAGPAVERLDPEVDLGAAPPAATSLPPGIAPSSFSVVWQGEVVPTYSEAYTFVVTSAGTADLSIAGQPLLPVEATAPPLAPACPHDICALGDKLAASTSYSRACHPCVDEVCAQDPFCCDGGYLSYYSTEPVWDAKCVAEVGAYCGLACTNPLPSPTTRQRSATPIALQAGVRYPIRLAVDNPGADVTTQLLWESARQAREVVPTSALHAAGAAAGAGAGLNVVVLGTTGSGGTVEPDPGAAVWSGAVPDLSLGSPLRGSPAVATAVLAPPADAAAAAPPPPVVVRPRAGDHVFAPAPQVSLTVIGGVRGGSVRVQERGTALDVVLPLDADGALAAGVVPLGGYGPHALVLTQRTFPDATCAAPATVCAESPPIDWSVTVDEQSPSSPPPPAMASPRDPTHTPDPADDVFQVTGQGLPAPVEACDQGGIGAAGVIAESLHAGPDGAISGTVTLTAGTAVDPNPGWHKLSLSQDHCATTSKPAFISVGVRPPTVEFPRSGAPVDCSAGGVVGQLIARGTIPYAEASFGPLVVGEELGHLALGLVSAQVTVEPTARADGSFGFVALLPGLPFGKHLLMFFQAPPPPAGATQAEIDAHFRAFASIASTPTSRIAITLPPPPLGLPAGPSPLVAGVAPTLGALGCALQPGPGCALPGADVVVHDAQRTWITRASQAGDWQLGLADLTPGWHRLTLGQVVDSPAGGGWAESCPSAELPVGVGALAGLGPALALPAALALDASGPGGAVVAYNARATGAAGASLEVACQPPSGSTFPIGVTDVLCTAFDPTTQAVAVGTFAVTVVDGPPVVSVPAGGITAEADSALGALVGYDVTATDAVSGPLPVDCVPAASPQSPALFPVGDTSVLCAATDGAGQTTTASFLVRVRDTIAPVLQLPAALDAVATTAHGSRVTYAATASDGVDPAPAVVCSPASGTTFPLGSTVATCAATDGSGNRAQASFPIRVTVAWSNLLAPIDLAGLASFLRGLPVPVQFTLTGPSAVITDLPARLFVAPVDAAGVVGAESPAAGLAPGVGNSFRYVPLLGEYLLTLGTGGMSAGTWQLRVDLGDGAPHTTRIRLR